MEFFQNEETNKIIFSTMDVSCPWVAIAENYSFNDEEITVKDALELVGLDTNINLTFCRGNDGPCVQNYLDTPIKSIPLSQFTIRAPNSLIN